MDRRFKPFLGGNSGTKNKTNTVSINEYVPKVEQYIHTVKERTEGIYNTLHFWRIP